jgi:hypothetical protein
MNRTRLAAVGLTLASLAGYAVGVGARYPGRAFSVTGVMVGLTLVAVSGAGAES